MCRHGLDEIRARYLSAQLRGERREALRVVVEDGLDSGISVSDLTEVVRQAQREIGSLWQENAIGIADEHMATAISQLAIARIYERTSPEPPNGRRILVACIEGELHDLPARLVADALDTAGFHACFLGANVPTDSLVKIVRARSPDMVVLSATMILRSTALRCAVARLRALPGERVPIAVGGNACIWSPELADELGADLTAPSATDFVLHAKLFFGVAAV